MNSTVEVISNSPINPADTTWVLVSSIIFKRLF